MNQLKRRVGAERLPSDNENEDIDNVSRVVLDHGGDEPDITFVTPDEAKFMLAALAERRASADGAEEQAKSRENGPATVEGGSKTHDESAPRQARSDYRADVDGLRALAVIAVVVYHMDRA